jgi:hypothetical protein
MYQETYISWAFVMVTVRVSEDVVIVIVLLSLSPPLSAVALLDFAPAAAGARGVSAGFGYLRL